MDPLILYVVIALFSLIIGIAVVVAILKIPQIAKDQRALLKILALQAVRAGLNKEVVQEILNDSDTKIIDAFYEKNLFEHQIK